ncbi:hypothetical protein AB3R30_07235 [Leptolyngbyaceae cyanobacterium UHCC 1019]
MSIDPIQNPLPGERILDVVPMIQPQIEPPVWHRHLNLFTGRSLSSIALTAEQQGRAGRLATYGQIVSAGVVQGLQVDTEREDAVWFGDALPPGAKPFPEDGESWNWVATNPTPLAGRRSHQSPLTAGFHQHGFIGATNRLVIHPGDSLIAYVYLDPSNPPNEILLQWHDWEANSWEHRAFWGANRIALGTDNTESRHPMGALPERGKWVRLEVSARQVGLEGKIVDGMIFNLLEGRAVWDQIGKARSLCRIAAGFGITAQGEDVIVLQEMRLALSDLPVYNQPKLLGQLVQPSENPLPATVGILVLQPVVINMVGKPRLPDDEDDQGDAFDDLEQIDGSRLLYYPWSSDWFALPEAGDRWRNRLAYAIFSAEKGNGLGEVMPWEEIGVPLALIAFDDAWNPLFIDSAAVVRSGGKPKARTPLVSNAGSPFLWQARMQQFAEQLAELDLSQISITQAANQFRYLPPVGVLPKEAIDARTNQDNFFPAPYVVQALPIPVEQLDLVMQASASLLPFDLFTPDQVQVLVPVPQQFYDPNLLQREAVDPLFEQTIQEFVNRRADWLQRRKLVRKRQMAIVRAITGSAPTYPASDPARLEIESDVPLSPQSRVHLSVVTTGLHQHYFEGADPALAVAANEVWAVWVYLDRDHPPRQIMLQWKANASWEHRAYWGENLIAFGENGTASRQFIGMLPEPGQWMRLEIPANLVGLTNTQVNGMAFTLYDGRAAWGKVSKQTPGTPEAVWVGDSLPNDQDGWVWATGEDQLSPFESSYQTESQQTERIALPLVNLRTELESVLPAEVSNLTDDKSIGRFVNELEVKVNQANDKIDFFFLQARTDIYRVRQLVLGSDAASRLVTSPALAEIAQGGKSARATQEEMIEFYQQAKTIEILTPIKTKDLIPKPLSPAVGGVPLVNAALPQNLYSPKMNVNPVSLGFSQGGSASSAFFSELGQILGKGQMMTSKFPGQGKGGTSAKPTFTADDVIEQSPTVGQPIHNVTVGERLQNPAAVEARKFAIKGRYEVIVSLIALNLNFGDKPIPGIRDNNKDITFSDLEDANLRNPILLKIQKGDFDPLPTLSDQSNQSNQSSQSNQVEADQSNQVEADYFSASIKTIDDTIATLRIAEGVVQTYRLAIVACRKTLADLQVLANQINQRLQAIDDGLAEARQDVSIARSLLREETARVQALNDRRDQIIRDFVPFLVFQRPREIDALIQTPTRTLNPGLTESPVPACLNRNIAVPAELQAMITVVREAPVQWFTRLPRLLDQLNQIEGLYRVMQTAIQRVTVLSNRNEVITNDRTAVGRGINRLYTAQQQMVIYQRIRIGQTDLNRLSQQNWQQSRQQAESVVSLGDLIEGQGDRSDLSQRAARELQDIAHVAACLYANIGEVLPVIRLEWAEILSQYDDPVNLQDLADLPRWTEISYLERRETQTLVDWLYQQINRNQPEAVALISDLVRICILLASHAPINQIITGRVAQPAIATQGNRVELEINPALVRIGMQVLLYSETNQIVAQGVVEDLAVGRASARIVQAYEKNAQLKESTRVQFSESHPPKRLDSRRL